MNDTKHELLNIKIGTRDIDSLVRDSMAAIDGEAPREIFACANAHSMAIAQGDADFNDALCDATMLVADGVGVTMVARLLDIEVGPRIAGADYFLAVLQALGKRGSGRVFFFGSSPEVLAQISGRFATEFPELTLCGYLSPPFRQWSSAENEEMLAKINAARPDVLWVGMTAPRQEKWVAANADKLTVKVVGSIGAVFDFYAGTVDRAPDGIRRLGLEWLYRQLREPRRMWRRTFVSIPRYLTAVLRHHVLS